MNENKHWVETLSQKIIEEKKPPYLITSGMTTSGPFHLGTLCEMLFPSTIQRYLTQQGHKTRFVFFADTLDAFDSIPTTLSKHTKELTPHLGKPLTDVPDPLSCCDSFGGHFLKEAEEIAKRFNIKPEIKKIKEVYSEGSFDKFAKLYLKNEQLSREIVFTSSLKKNPPDHWSPIMPICQNCGRIATTQVTGFDENSYTYLCDRDIGYTKGCGYSGSNKISDHKYKITWRLHWPAWMNIYGPSSVEGAGVDHHTRGGSWDTAVAIHKGVFKSDPPIPYKFGFVLLKGRKYSKSKGIGMGVTDVLSLVPPEMIKYSLLKPDVQENKNFDPIGNNMLRLYEDYQGAASLPDKDLTRADRKRKVAFELSTEKLNFSVKFIDLLLTYQLYKDWGTAIKSLGDEPGILYLKPFITRWLDQKYAPEEYLFEFNPQPPTENTDAVFSFINRLKEGMGPEDIHNEVFKVATEVNLKPGALFKSIYNTLISKDRGPRLGKFIYTIGIEKTKQAILGLKQ
ncbi:MAG: lysine--tRNA ligase [Candidatus Micrarchaeota archaeon]